VRLLTPEQTPNLLQGTVCRQSRLAVLLVSVVMAVMIIGIPAFLLWQVSLPWWIKLAGAGITGLVARWLIGNVLKCWRGSNWLMRIAPDGLWVNIRSYQNPDLPPGRTVVHLPYDEIDQVCEHIWKRTERSAGGTTMWTDRYFEIRLAGPAVDELRSEIAEERRRHVERSHLGGVATSRSRSGHVPVTVTHDNTIRLAWRGRFDWVSPPLRRVLRELEGRVTVGAATNSELSNSKNLNSEEVDSLTLQLVESGDKLGAVKLLTDRRGYSTTEAHRFVEELTATL
jgi:hypothetical protein